MHRLRPFMLLLFVVGILFVASEPEGALAHTKVHPGALALGETARVADAPSASSPVVVIVTVAVVALVVGLLTRRPAVTRAARPGTDRPPVDVLAREPFAPRGPPTLLV